MARPKVVEKVLRPLAKTLVYLIDVLDYTTRIHWRRR
ncbi:MAG: hypothetical protein Ct9H300mP28_03000 [Pseudomonadota bacterium]|nr:MAG: hypothetical protein Ct9H300mP28_03000 [Pseudomonadota bacterium]